MSIFVAVPIKDRLQVGKLCLANLHDVFSGHCIKIYDDCSVFPVKDVLNKKWQIARTEPAKGIHAQRLMHLVDFSQNTNFEFIYLTDSDAFHDPQAPVEMLTLFAKTKLPVSCYQTIKHQTRGKFRSKDYSIHTHAAGISWLLHLSHVKAILEQVEKAGGIKEWDFDFCKFLGYQFAITNTSYVDHYGKHGLHNRDYIEDRAINPTPYLLEQRAKNVSMLEQEYQAYINQLNEKLQFHWGAKIQ